MVPSSNQLSWGLSTASTSSSQAHKPPPVIQRAQSPNPRSRPSQLANTKNPGGGVNLLEIGEGSSSAPSTAVSSLAVMTKEEKALEMTRRKEERKQVCF